MYAGWVLGTPQTEEAQNRLVAYKCQAVVVSVDYRKCVARIEMKRSITNCAERRNIRIQLRSMIVTMHSCGNVSLW